MNPDHEFLQVTETSLPLTKRSVVMQNSAAPGHCRFGLCTDSHYAEKEALEDKHYAEALLKMEELFSYCEEKCTCLAKERGA